MKSPRAAIESVLLTALAVLFTLPTRRPRTRSTRDERSPNAPAPQPTPQPTPDREPAAVS
jgi:hypothetical protein